MIVPSCICAVSFLIFFKLSLIGHGLVLWIRTGYFAILSFWEPESQAISIKGYCSPFIIISSGNTLTIINMYMGSANDVKIVLSYTLNFYEDKKYVYGVFSQVTMLSSPSFS